MKSYKVEEDLYLNEIQVKVPEIKEEKVKSKHQYIIIDRSGSMYYDIDQVVETIIKYVDTLSEGSKVSLGYFSGYGQYGLSVPYTLTKEKDGVVKTVETYRNVGGCTNFTEILEKINEDCKDESSLFFFTDGYHNCGSFYNVVDVLKQLKNKLLISVFVGCGWINRENMLEMAKTTEGSFIQLNNFNQFEETLFNFGESLGEVESSVEITLPEKVENICSLLGKNVICYTIEDGKISYKPSTKKKQIVYCTSKEPLYDVCEISSKDEVCARTLIYNLVQTNQVPLALKILDKLGDKHLINKLYNTFTNEEYAEIENILLKSIFDSRKRYKEGKVQNYLPKDDAWCILDCLDTLTNDPKAKVCLNDPEFTYKKVSRAAIQTDGSKLELPKEIKASANNLKYNDTRLNVNLNVMYEAKVPLKAEEFKETNAINESLTSYGLKDKYPVTCIRNYNIILDGKLQTEKLILMNLSKETVNKLGNELVLREDGKYVLTLSGLPIINKSYLKNSSAKQLAYDCWQDFLISNSISVLKYLKTIKTPTDVKDKDVDKEAFLLENYYIKNGMYQPPKESVEATDEYQCYEFSISFKGYSKASASSVIKKLNEGKKVTAREKIVEYYYNQYKDYKVQDIEKLLEAKTIEHKNLQTNIQHAKFAIILINRGCMDEFRNRDDMSLEIDTTGSNIGIDKITTVFKIEQKAVKI